DRNHLAFDLAIRRAGHETGGQPAVFIHQQPVTNAHFFTGLGDTDGQHITVFGIDVAAGNAPGLQAKELSGIRIHKFLAATENTHAISWLLAASVDAVSSAGDDAAILT